jgi:hypothetical protein
MGSSFDPLEVKSKGCSPLDPRQEAPPPGPGFAV